MIHRRMRRRFTAAALVLAAVAAAPGRADEGAASAPAWADGVYEAKEVVAAGVYSGGEWDEAQAFVGHFLTIHGGHVVLPTATLCHVVSAEDRTLRNDRESFGSAGGSWSEVGLAHTAEGHYDVVEITLDCDGPFHTILLQPASDVYLLGYWSVYLAVGRETDG